MEKRDKNGGADLLLAEMSRRPAVLEPVEMAMTESFDDTDWRRDAACREVDTSVFFPDTEEEAATATAKAICAACPVREPCLSFALANRQEQGVWGGLTETERRRMRRRRAEAARAARRHAA